MLDERSEAILFLRSWFTFERERLERGYRVHLGANVDGNQARGRVTTAMNKLQQMVTQPVATAGKVGDWQQVDVRFTSEDLSVTVDGVVTTRARAVGDGYGYVAFQTTRGRIQFRSVEVESLSQAPEFPSVPPTSVATRRLSDSETREMNTVAGLSQIGPSKLVDPKVLREVRPVYTEDAMRSRMQGTVRLEVVVRDDGTVGDVKVVQRLHPALDVKAIEAARKWRFTPATQDGKPVAVYVTLELSFKIF
jgi:protein TonB